MRHTVSISLVLIVLWLINSGHYTPLLLSFGLVSVVLVVYLSYRMDIVDKESLPFYLSKGLPTYYGWLLKEIVKSNIDVSIRAWRGPDSISPTMGKLPVNQRTDMGKVIYANSLTLTPGTVTVELGDDYLLAHTLTKSGMDELLSGSMSNKVLKLESH